MQRRDSLFNTLLVATVLCVVCSLAVSTAAVKLRPRQDTNEKLDQQRNILDATSVIPTTPGYDGYGAMLSIRVYRLDTGLCSQPKSILSIQVYRLNMRGPHLREIGHSLQGSLCLPAAGGHAAGVQLVSNSRRS